MSVNSMSVGKDYALVFVDGDTGASVDLGDVQNIHITANKHAIKSMPYNDVPRYGYIPDGYALRMTVTRTSAILELLQLAANRRFNDGQSTLAGTLNETVREANGTVSRFQYTRVVIWVDDIGDITREAPVKMTIEMMASDKIQIA